MKNTTYLKLNIELPMTQRMYLKLINNYFKSTMHCINCPKHNGECLNFAKIGQCKAMNEKMNEVLVFKDEYYEFATTRYAIAKALEMNQDNDENIWIGENVNAVIEDYLYEKQYNNESTIVCTLMNLLPDNDILECIEENMI